MLISLSRAALLANVGKNTIARAVKSGKLTATRGEHNRYFLDEEEVRRVFNLSREGLESGLKAEIERLTRDLEQARRERDEWKARYDRLMETYVFKS
jgi:hypothetical protein